MTNIIHPFQPLVIALAGWLNRHPQAVIDYLIEENSVLKDQLDGQRPRFTDEQRMRLAVKAKVPGKIHRCLQRAFGPRGRKACSMPSASAEL